MRQEHKYSELTGQIIGCSMTVHSALGNGFQEVIYQRALEIEMADHGISFSREHVMPIYCKEQHIGTRRVDFLIDNVVCGIEGYHPTGRRSSGAGHQLFGGIRSGSRIAHQLRRKKP